MTAWQPRRGERVLAVLPDGHEIEGEYCESVDGTHTVLIANEDELVIVRTVKPLPVTEPTAFGARVIDGNGQHWVRTGQMAGPWRCEDTDWEVWSEIPQPVTLIDADPDWGES